MMAGSHTQLNVTSADEHVPEIEWYICTVKERCRAIFNTLPFTKMSNVIVVHMVYFSVFWLNIFPVKDGLSTHISPQTIMTCLMVDFNIHSKLEFGVNVQTHEPHNNEVNFKTIGYISFGPRGNAQGGYRFMSLVTAERIFRRKWKSLPIPEKVILRVYELVSCKNTEKAYKRKELLQVSI
jgi:hypothetical protein